MDVGSILAMVPADPGVGGTPAARLDPESAEWLRVLACAGGPAEQRYPGIAAHLRACGPCGDDFDGLLAALREQAP